jgi:hypothetical protein
MIATFATSVPGFVAWRPGSAQAAPVSREILALYDSTEAKPGSELSPLRTSLIHALAEMPLNYLGLKLRYLDVETEPLPSDDEMRRYRGIISWFGDDRLRNAEAYLRWLQRQITAGRSVVVLGGLGASVDGTSGAEVDAALVDGTFAMMGLRYASQVEGRQTDNPLVLMVRRKVPEMVEFERTLDDELATYEQYRSFGSGNRVYLTIARTDLLDGDSDVVVTGPWGGFVLGGYEYFYQPRSFQKRWRINPFAFFDEAFGVTGMPRPDVSTLNGSRVFYTHIDGDGFNNITEMDYLSLSSEVLLKRFIKRYDLPFSFSIVVNDIDPASSLGGDRQLKVAREIFAMPNVEPASHTYTHPFDWSKPFDLEREITGALNFLNQWVAQPTKPVRLLLWSGATNPNEAAVARSDELGLFNINGGDGRFDSMRNSYSSLASLTTQVGARTQFYTSNANDNIYGNDWTGPYYGLKNVVETWQKTESPRRIGAMNVYYHIFTGEKFASVRALETVYDYALTQPIAPMYTTEYLQLVQGFLSTELARSDQDTWTATNFGALRTLRFDGEQRHPDLDRSQNVIGYWHYQGSLYVFLGEGTMARIALTSARPTRPYVARASHRILDAKLEPQTLTFAMEGVGQKKVAIANLPPNTDYDLVATAGGREQRARLRTDAEGVLAWATDARGRIQLTAGRVPGATGPR